MKRIVASVGLAAISAASIQGASAQSISPVDNSKPWSVSLALRGFYDDNVGTTPDGAAGKVDTFGLEISPAVSYAMPLTPQTDVALAYKYSYKYYDEKPPGNADHDDQTHKFDALLAHRFSERLNVRVMDSFVIGQEPDLLARDSQDTAQRISGDNIRNHGAIVLNAEITPVFGAEAGYANVLFDYRDDGVFGRLLDRLEHIAHIDGRWNVQPDTVGLVGYQFKIVDYTADRVIATDPITFLPVMSDDRNSRSHYGYVGVEHHFWPTLFGALRAGIRYTDYYNNPSSVIGDDSAVSPYVKGNLRYTYAEESSLDVGVSYDRTTTDQLSNDAETALAYGTVTHRILPSLYGKGTVTLQHSTFDGGASDGESEWIFLAGLSLEYRFNRHFSASLGYSYDKLDSDLGGRSFDRNRVYLGATATY